MYVPPRGGTLDVETGCSYFSPTAEQYLYIRHNNLYLLALTKRNTNAAEILLFLHKIVEVFTEYFKELEEESIRDNFVIIYELLDEMMDFGYPQTTESKILQEWVYLFATSTLGQWDMELREDLFDREALTGGTK